MSAWRAPRLAPLAGAVAASTVNGDLAAEFVRAGSVNGDIVIRAR